MGNTNMHEAKRNKNDEFYTQLTDIEQEMRHYRGQFKGKKVFMNCDDPTESNFWMYFYLNFEFLGLKKITSTFYHDTESTYRLDYDGTGEPVKTPLEQNGDFRSPESIDILKESDIVVTNPPFSLFREYMAQLMEYRKDFLVIGNMNAVSYKEVFPLFKDNKVWMGQNNGSFEFEVPVDFEKNNTYMEDGKKYAKFGNIVWFTNLRTPRQDEDTVLFKQYNEEDYPKYDNYDAINVDRVANIPLDYDGVMGVPITFITKYNPSQFKILGMAAGNSRATGLHYTVPYKQHKNDRGGCGVIEGKRKYTRIFIQKKESK